MAAWMGLLVAVVFLGFAVALGVATTFGKSKCAFSSEPFSNKNDDDGDPRGSSGDGDGCGKTDGNLLRSYALLMDGCGTRMANAGRSSPPMLPDDYIDPDAKRSCPSTSSSNSDSGSNATPRDAYIPGNFLVLRATTGATMLRDDVFYGRVKYVLVGGTVLRLMVADEQAVRDALNLDDASTVIAFAIADVRTTSFAKCAQRPLILPFSPDPLPPNPNQAVAPLPPFLLPPPSASCVVPTSQDRVLHAWGFGLSASSATPV